MRTPTTAGVLTALLTLTLVSGCRGEGGDPFGAPAEPPDSPELRTVPLRVAEQGQATLAFVPVTIDGHGPYRFALDTGASRSLVDTQVADEVGLRRTGERQRVAGLVGEERVPIAAVQRWQAGDVPLGSAEIAVTELPGPERGQGLQGLLGSDLLSRFDYVVVDYDDGELRLPPE